MSNNPTGPFLFDPLPEPDPLPESDEGTEDPGTEGSATTVATADDARSRQREDPTGVDPRADDSDPDADPTQSKIPPVLPAAPGGFRRPQQILFEEPAEEAADSTAEPQTGRTPRAAAPDRVSPLARLTSGLLDLAAVLSVALTGLLGLRLLGVEPRLELLPGVVLFVIVFSFVYHVFPLLFWGCTPGMASADLVTRDPSGQTLTAWQSTLRWAGSLGTVIFAGIPMIVSWFTGWSLADLVSGSETKVDS